MLGDVREELDAVVAAERRGIERRLAEAGSDRGDEDLRRMLSDMAARRQAELDALPEDLGDRIRGLRDYDFLEPAARERFEALLDRLGRQVLDSWFEGLSESIRGATPDQLAANREMVRDLDRLLRERLDGREPDQSEVDEFLGRHGAFFPGAKDPRRHRRAARRPDGCDAVAPGVDDARTAGRAAVDDGRAPARRSAALGPRPARVDARPAAARRARPTVAVQRR